MSPPPGFDHRQRARVIANLLDHVHAGEFATVEQAILTPTHRLGSPMSSCSPPLRNAGSSLIQHPLSPLLLLSASRFSPDLIRQPKSTKNAHSFSTLAPPRFGSVISTVRCCFFLVPIIRLLLPIFARLSLAGIHILAHSRDDCAGKLGLHRRKQQTWDNSPGAQNVRGRSRLSLCGPYLFGLYYRTVLGWE